MSLKSLIQRLLDSRTTPAQAGHSAMPSASETVLLTQNDAFQSWGNIHQGVAADDGYVNIFARSVNNTTSEMRVLTSGMTFSSAQTEAEKDMACSAPVAKGQTYTIKGIQVKGIKIIFVKTLGAIGGGYKDFIRRALSCLRALSNYLPRCFCKANPNGLAAKVIHQAIRSRSQAGQVRGENTQPPMTAISISTQELTKRPRSITVRFTQTMEQASAFLRLPQVTRASLSLFAKVRKSATTLDTPTPRKQAPRIFTSLSLSAHHNLLSTGGALC